MYKVLLVDDEILIRERIARRIPWEELGFELIASCENGQEAIKVLEQESVDLVFTDIRFDQYFSHALSPTSV